MTIPSSSNYPEDFDTDDNLFLVHDALRLKLVEDYLPGDTSITVDGEASVLLRIPETGIITLTEQCSDIDKRAISFYYSTWNATDKEFSGLELLPEFTDVKKAKRITNVTFNVVDLHHNHIKDAVIAVEEFCGVEGTVDTVPLGDTLEGRVNFLRNVALQPKAWFRSNKRTGNVPLEIEFEEQSFRLGTDGDSGTTTLTWDFGDQNVSVVSLISTISTSSLVPESDIDVYVRDTDAGKIKKIYYQPGVYNVKLTVTNDFGSDTVTFEDFVTARVKAPDPAIIQFIENSSSQEVTEGVPPDGPFDTTPKIRSPINTIIQIQIPEGENDATPDVGYSGEALDSDGDPIDPIVNWTWALGDDLIHPNTRDTTASYSIGGLYDIKLRVDTDFGAYRITTYENAIDVIETQNIWLWVFDDDEESVMAYEYGLISETFKLADVPAYSVDRNYSFLDDAPNEIQQKKEFKRNVGFAKRGTVGSGNNGTALLYYASGRDAGDAVSTETIKVVEFNGFAHTYTTHPTITRGWNWANLNSSSYSFFVFGEESSYLPNTSPTNLSKQTYNLSTLTVATHVLTDSDFYNGAQELKENVSSYDDDGEPLYGHFSVYRTAWKDNTGYILRNDGVGPFFRLKSFYRTEGTVAQPFVTVRKLQDIQGPTKEEGQLVSLTSGVYLLNNSGSVSQFDAVASVWRTGGPGANSLLYRNLQDTTVAGYDDVSNSLLAISDGDKRAYLSFDYSSSAFLKFNEISLTFTNLGSRPNGEQWLMGLF